MQKASTRVPLVKIKEFMRNSKVEKVLKGNLESILSPSVKIQIVGVKVCLRFKGKTLLGIVNKLFENKKFVDITQ